MNWKNSFCVCFIFHELSTEADRYIKTMAFFEKIKHKRSNICEILRKYINLTEVYTVCANLKKLQ